MRRWAPRFLLLITLLATFLVYKPGLQGPFVFDDSLNILSNQYLRLQDLSAASLRDAVFSGRSGIFFRPISMLTFGFNFYFLDGHVTTFSFKLINLIIHLLSGLAVFAFTKLLIGFYSKHRQPQLPATYPTWLALAVTAAWLLHPLNLTSVLYVVQRMTSLAALFSFVGLGAYVWGRIRLFTGQSHGIAAILGSLLVFTPLAILSKENGALLPFFMLALELTLFKFETHEPRGRYALTALFIVVVALPTLALAAYIFQHPNWLIAGYAKRDFGLTERLMTEARIVWFYLRLIVLPSTALMGLFHDDFTVSRHLLDPVMTLPAIIGILALLGSVWFLRRRSPLAAFGILFFLVGHSMESTLFPLELVHEHRNYLPMYGILLVFFHVLLTPLHAVTTKFPRRALAILLIALFAANTFSRAASWATPGELWETEAEHHPDSARTAIEMAVLRANVFSPDPVEMDSNYRLARHDFERAVALQKSNVNGLFGLIQLSAFHGRPLEGSWVRELARRLETEILPANVNDRLIALVNCRMQASCPLHPSDIEALIHAALRNPKVQGGDRALVYSALGYYLFNITRDYPAAVDAMQHSIALVPYELEYRLTLIKFLIFMQKPNEARAQIAMFKKLDRSASSNREIIILEKQL